MYIILTPDIGYETKRKYLRNPERYLSSRRKKVFRRLFVEGADLDFNHIHFEGGKNEMRLLHLMDTYVTRFIAGFLGLPYGSTLYIHIPLSRRKIIKQHLAFDSSGLDFTSIKILHRVLHFTSEYGLRGVPLCDRFRYAIVRKGRDVLYHFRRRDH